MKINKKRLASGFETAAILALTFGIFSLFYGFRYINIWAIGLSELLVFFVFIPFHFISRKLNK